MTRRLKRIIGIGEALSDAKLLGASLGDQTSWTVWRAVLKAAYGEALTKAERAAFDSVAGGRSPPRRKVRELIVVVSRRAGKGRMAGALCAYEAVLARHALAPGEIPIVACISPTRRQAEIVQNYAEGFLQSSALLHGELSEIIGEEIRLRSGAMITTLAADHRSLRGRTLLLAVLDEAAFLDDGDIETARALLPGLATTGGMLMVLSSPFRRSGLVFERHRDYFGKDSDDVLVVAGPSSLFNPTLDADMIEAAREADPEAAASEWFGEFRRDLATLFDDDMIEAATDRSRPVELPPRAGVQYLAHTDAAGGGGGDSYTLAIGHREGDDLIVDVVRGTAGKFSPTAVTASYAALLREYKINSVWGDHYAPGWIEAEFSRHGIAYRRCEPTRSEFYLNTVPILARGAARIPDHAKLVRELRSLERQAHRNGKETASHPRGGHDDFANVVCGLLCSLNTAPRSLWQAGDFFSHEKPSPLPARADALFASIIANEHGVAGVVFGCYRSIANPPLVIIDYDLLPLSPSMLRAIVDRLALIAKDIAVPAGMILAQSPVAAELERLGYHQGIQVIDHIASDDMLPVSAAGHIGAGRVKLSAVAKDRTGSLPLGLLEGARGDDGDAVRLAGLVAVAAAFDPGRNVTRRAA